MVLMTVVSDNAAHSRPRGRKLGSPGRSSSCGNVGGRRRGRSASGTHRTASSSCKARHLSNQSDAISKDDLGMVASSGCSVKDGFKRAEAAQNSGLHAVAEEECSTALQRFRPDDSNSAESLLAELLLVRAVSRAALHRWAGALSDSDRAFNVLHVPWEDELTPVEGQAIPSTGLGITSDLPSSIPGDASTLANRTEECSAFSAVGDRFVGRDLLVLRLLDVEIKGTWRTKQHPRLQVAICRLLALDSRVRGESDWTPAAFAMLPRIILEAAIGRFPKAKSHATALLQHLLEAPERIASFLGVSKALTLLFRLAGDECIGVQDLAIRGLSIGLCRCEQAFEVLPKLRLVPSLLKPRGTDRKCESDVMTPYLRFLLTAADKPLGRRVDLSQEELRSLLNTANCASADSVIAAILLSCRWLPQGARETERVTLGHAAIQICSRLIDTQKTLSGSDSLSNRSLEEGYLVQALAYLRPLLSVRWSQQAEPLQRGTRYESAIRIFNDNDGAIDKVAAALIHAIRFVNNAWPKSPVKPKTQVPKCSESPVLQGFPWIERAMNTDVMRQLLLSWLLDFAKESEHCKLLLNADSTGSSEIIDFCMRELGFTGGPELLRLLVGHGWLHAELASEAFFCQELLGFCDRPDSSIEQERRNLILVLTLLLDKGGGESRRWAEKLMLSQGVARTLRWADLQIVQPDDCYVLLRKMVVHGGLSLAMQIWSQRRSCFETTQVLERTLLPPSNVVVSSSMKEWQHLCLTVIQAIALHNGFQGAVRAVSIESLLPVMRNAAKASLPGSAEALEALLLQEEPRLSAPEAAVGPRRWAPLRLHSSAVDSGFGSSRNLVRDRTDLEKSDVFDTSLACASVCEWSEKKRALGESRMERKIQQQQPTRSGITKVKTSIVYPHSNWKYTAKFLVSSPTKRPGTYQIDPRIHDDLNDGTPGHTYENMGSQRHS